MRQLMIIFTIFLSFVNAGIYFSQKEEKKEERVVSGRAFEEGFGTRIESIGVSRPQLGVVVPGYLDYEGIGRQLESWESEASDLVELGTYGKSTRGRDLRYIRLTNEMRGGEKGKVLITAGIHGNEVIGVGVIMGVIGKMLSEWSERSLLNTREVYFIPVVSPDSYPLYREVDGVDPNRNFSGNSVLPIRYLKEFFLVHDFGGVISGHSYGRVWLKPYGDRRSGTVHNGDYDRILGKMSKMSGYGIIYAWEAYNHPIYGTELDWYYGEGSFPVVLEMGTHQGRVSSGEINNELNKVYDAILYFIEESVKVRSGEINNDIMVKSIGNRGI